MLLVDCGATGLVALKAQGLDPNAVDAVAVTHLHGDHFGGLPFLILDGWPSTDQLFLGVAVASGPALPREGHPAELQAASGPLTGGAGRLEPGSRLLVRVRRMGA